MRSLRATILSRGATTENGGLGTPRLLFLAVLMGIGAGLGAVVFRALIALFHNVFYSGIWSLDYDANLHTAPSPWGIGVILVPIAGAVGVAWLVKSFAPEAKGHGVPEVMDAIYYQQGRIRPRVAVIKSLASALSIGSGGSIGREGPIIQIGSALGATLGNLLKIPFWQRVTLIAAGAGGGIAATFNTPVGGVLFAVEIIMIEVSARTLLPVIISTATATYIGQQFFGPYPAFVIPALERSYLPSAQPALLAAYAGLGVIAGLASALFIRALYGTEDWFSRRVGGSYYRQHVLGMAVVGIMIYLLMTFLGHYYVEGVGYATVQDVLNGQIGAFAFLLSLFLLKLAATCLTLGSGASGGVFSPSMFMGATLGGAYGASLHLLFPAQGIDAAAFAVAGMAGMVGGGTGAALTAIVMIFEMTRDYSVVLPMTLTVAMAYAVRRAICPETLYTLKLTRRGHHMPQALHTNFAYLWRAGEIMDNRFQLLPETATYGSLSQGNRQAAPPNYLLLQDPQGRVAKALNFAEIRHLCSGREDRLLAEDATDGFIMVSASDTLFDIIIRLREANAALALVAKNGGNPEGSSLLGVISKAQISEMLANETRLLSNG